MNQPVIYNLKIARPAFSSPQEESFTWLPAAHAQADQTKGDVPNAERYEKILRRVGCSPKQIAFRGHVLADFNHTDWSAMQVYRLHEAPMGPGSEKRTRAFLEAADAAFAQLYPGDEEAPEDLIHVTCTGYVSPSPAQKLVERKGWSQTEVTHAYHMGCYGAFPAVRLARGFIAASPEKKRVDVVHTEICSLHLNPSDHALDNFVVQTLFADGFARYSVARELPSGAKAGLQLLTSKENIIPNTQDAMTWLAGDVGMKMTLSKDVPGLVAQHVAGFLERLVAPLGLSAKAIASEARFAVHPGGPKILDSIESTLGLRPEQIETSRGVLRDYGNMSSATVPHIWERLVNDPAVPAGSWVVSFAFGPGLTLCGSVLRKVA